jgi:hypothetical protein
MDGFSGWGGGRERKRQGTFNRVGFHLTTHVFKQTHVLCYILYIEQWWIHYIKFQNIVKSVLDLDTLGSVCALFNLRQPVDLFHSLKTVKGLLHLVPSRTPRRSGYGVFKLKFRQLEELVLILALVINRPCKNKANNVMIYCVGPEGDQTKDAGDFMYSAKETGENFFRAVAQYNDPSAN